MKRALLILFACLSLALTPAEKVQMREVHAELQASIADFQAADIRIVDADGHALSATNFSIETEKNLITLQGKINEAHERERHLVLELNPLRELKKKVYARWGLGGIALGFSILMKHLLVVALIGAGLVAALYALSFLFPVIGVGLRIAGAFLKRLVPRKK